MRQVDQVRFMDTVKAAVSKHIIEFTECFGDQYLFTVSGMDQGVGPVRLAIGDLLHLHKVDAVHRPQHDLLFLPEVGPQVLLQRLELGDKVLLDEGLRVLHRFGQFLGIDRFEQEIHCCEPERLDRIFLIGGDEDDPEIEGITKTEKVKGQIRFRRPF